MPRAFVLDDAGDGEQRAIVAVSLLPRGEPEILKLRLEIDLRGQIGKPGQPDENARLEQQ